MIASVSQFVDRLAMTVGALAMMAALPVAAATVIAQSLA